MCVCHNMCCRSNVDSTQSSHFQRIYNEIVQLPPRVSALHSCTPTHTHTTTHVHTRTHVHTPLLSASFQAFLFGEMADLNYLSHVPGAIRVPTNFAHTNATRCLFYTHKVRFLVVRVGVGVLPPFHVSVRFHFMLRCLFCGFGVVRVVPLVRVSVRCHIVLSCQTCYRK